MFHATIKINEKSILENTINLLRKKAEQQGLSNTSMNSLVEEFTEIVTPLLETGRTMKKQGSSINIQRTIKGSTYSVDLIFSTTSKTNYFEKLSNYLFSR